PVSFVEGSSHVAIRPDRMTVVVVDVVVAPREFCDTRSAACDLRPARVVVDVRVGGVVPRQFVALDEHIGARLTGDTVLPIVVDIVAASSLIRSDLESNLVVTGFIVFEYT